MSIATAYKLMPLIILIYTAVTLIANWQVRSKWMIVYPYYALFQALVMPIVGALFYIQLCLKLRRTGRYRIGVRRRRMSYSWIRAAFVRS